MFHWFVSCLKLNVSNVSTLIWVRLLVLTKGHLNQLVDIGTMHSLGMDNWNLKLVQANFTIKEAKWEPPKSSDVPRDGHDPLLIEK